MSLKYHVWTIGCQMNFADSRHVMERLEALGLTRVDYAEQADLVVLNTCVVRQQAEDKVVGRIGTLARLKRKNPGAMIALMGCLVGQNDDTEPLRKRFPLVDVFAPPSRVDLLMERLMERHPEWAPAVAREMDVTRTSRNAVTAFVPVVLGCSFGCSYCVIPSRRGPEQSVPADHIIREISALAADGVREVMLLGQIVDRYGHDFPGGKPNLSELLRRVAAIDGLLRVRFLTSHPTWFDEELLETIATERKICPQLEIAAQSGDDEVLKNMRRGYTRGQFCDLVRRVRGRLPDAAIHTDIIVGFPGETEAQFAGSERLLREMEFDKVHIAKYSPRPGTPAARLADSVPPEEKERRRLLLEKVQSDIQARKNKALEGQTVEILVEGMDDRRKRGRTRRNQAAHFESSSADIGQLAEVVVDWAGPFSLIGHEKSIAENA